LFIVGWRRQHRAVAADAISLGFWLVDGDDDGESMTAEGADPALGERHYSIT
jgi:hypothetical protein